MTPQPCLHSVPSLDGDYEIVMWPGKRPPATQTPNQVQWAHDCPWSVGTVLYGRERFTVTTYDGGYVAHVKYEADKSVAVFAPLDPKQFKTRLVDRHWHATMPHWASRIHRIVTKVSVVDMDAFRLHNATQTLPAVVADEIASLPRYVWLIEVGPVPVVNAADREADARNVAVKERLTNAIKELQRALLMGMKPDDDANIDTALNLVRSTFKGLATT